MQLKRFHSNIPCCLLGLLLTCASASAEEKVYELDLDLEVALDERPFESSAWRIESCNDSSYVCSINGKTPFGVEGTVPRTYLHSLTLRFKDVSYSLETSSMFNAWGSRPLEHPGVVRYLSGYCESVKSCTVRGIFSDAAGTFVAEWQVRGGIAERTVLTNASDIVHLFLRDIGPPRYE